MLNVVVLPAPFGPMMPTISHSPSRMLTSRAAWMPPNRMERPWVSSTDIADRHLLDVPGVQVEAVPGKPSLDRTDLLPQPARRGDEGDDDDHRQEEDAERAGGEAGELAEVRLDQWHLGGREHQHGEQEDRTADADADPPLLPETEQDHDGADGDHEDRDRVLEVVEHVLHPGDLPDDQVE